MNLFATITNGENYTIWTKAYPNNGCKEISTAEEFNDTIVIVKKAIRQKKGNTTGSMQMEKQLDGWTLELLIL